MLASVVFDTCGQYWEAEGGRQGGVEVKEVELGTFNKSTCHVIMSIHDHIHTTKQLCDRVMSSPPHHHRSVVRKMPLPSHEGCGPICMGKNAKGARS